MLTAETAFGLRERCGCLVAVTVMDETRHYAATVSRWQSAIRRGSKCRIETMSVTQAREELGRTFDAAKRLGSRHWQKKRCLDGSCVRPASRRRGHFRERRGVAAEERLA